MKQNNINTTASGAAGGSGNGGSFDDFSSSNNYRGDTSGKSVSGYDSRRNTFMDVGSSTNRSNSVTLFADSTNLYKSILNDVAQRDDMKESHLLVLGDRSAGKRSII